jgi:hypothetical protein
MRWRCLVVLVLVLGGSAQAHAEGVCFIGRSDCDWLILVETTLGYTRAASPQGRGDLFTTAELGALVKVGPRQDVGLLVGATTSPFATNFLLVQARYRYWLTDHVGVEGSLACLHGTYGVRDYVPGVRMEGAIELADEIGLTTNVDLASGGVTELGIGVRFGGFAALSVAAAMTALVLAYSPGY